MRELVFCFIIMITSASPAVYDPEISNRAAEQLLESMDLSVDPCQDFFQYACGGWIKKNPIPESRSTWSHFTILEDKLTRTLNEILKAENNLTEPKPIRDSRDLYASCIDTATSEALGLNPLIHLLKDFMGGWPIVTINWNETDFNMISTLTKTLTTYGTDYILGINNDLDVTNTTKSSIYIDQGSLSLDRDTLLDNNSSEVMKAYENYTIEAAKALREFLNNSVSDNQILSDVESILKFESQLANIMTSDEDRKKESLTYNVIILNYLQEWTDNTTSCVSPNKIDWLTFFNEIYGLVNITIPIDEELIVIELNYLQDLAKLLSKTPRRVVANYIGWRLVQDLAKLTNQKMIDLHYNFTKIRYDGVTKPRPRWSFCTKEVNLLLGFAVGAEYVIKEKLDQGSKTEIVSMIANLKKGFKSLVDEASWMDSVTKSIAKEKADSMTELVAFPDWILNKTALESYYQGVTVNKSAHFETVRNISAYLNLLELKVLRQLTDRTKWVLGTYPAVINAYYSQEYNSITFPAGILQSPFYVKGRLQAINYGAIGSVIGHEITHGFDDQGRQSDKNGNIAQWWTYGTLANYEDRSRCFIAEYSNFTVNNKSYVNGRRTLGENVADNGGLRESFRAYCYYVSVHGSETNNIPISLKNYTSEQLFFLSYANMWCGISTPEQLESTISSDVHSPARDRVLGPLSNNQDFSKAFQCAVGTRMNPTNKCILW